MISGLFGQGTVTRELRGGLEELSATHRTIAAKVASLNERSTTDEFAGKLAASLDTQELELQRQMASLADTQLRYEAAAKLLQKSYADLRTAINDRG